MTWSKTFKYWGYWLTASTRYKIHSPFVFDFIENVLRKNNAGDISSIEFTDNLRLAKKYKDLIGRIIAYYHLFDTDRSNTIVILPHDYEDTLYRTDTWQVAGGSVKCIIYTSLRDSTKAEMEWKEVFESRNAMLTIDIFDIGLVFYGEQFKVKQHFVLRF
jgi:hypothetical protein